MLPVSTYSFQIPANGAFPLQVNGRYFRVNAASGSLKVIGDTFGPMGAVAVGQGLRLPKESPVFQRLTLVDTSGAANNVTMIVADADFVDNTVLGTVNVVDGGKARTLAAAAFCASPYALPVANQYPFVQLTNATTTKNLIVEQITVGSSAAGGFDVFRNGAPTGAVQASRVGSKLVGSASTADVTVRQGNNAAALNTNGVLLSGYVGANASVVWKPSNCPIVVPPQWDLIVQGSLGAGINVTFECFEEAVQ